MKIIVDSGCDLTNEMKIQDGISIESVPLHLSIESKQYIDDDSLNIDNYLIDMKSSSNSPKTAAPSPQAYMDKFSGDESVFAVTLSSKLSCSYNNAVIAKEMYQSEKGDKFIHVFDSLSASVAETMIALKINEFIKKNLHETEIVQKVNNFINGMHTYFILEKYDNLVKNGRIGPYIARIASMLSIKPICMAKDGEMVVVDKVRGAHKALIKLAEIITSEKINYENLTLAISHVKCKEKALFLKSEILKRVKFKDIIIVEAGGLVSTYADDQGLVVSF